MGVITVSIYSAGNDHIVRGISCSIKRVDFYSLGDYIGNGWYKSPEELSQPEAPNEDEETIEVSLQATKKKKTQKKD